MKRVLGLALLVIAGATLGIAQSRSHSLPGVRRTWRIAFVRDGGIWVCAGDGSGQKVLIPNGYSPSWSPDRSRIAFGRDGEIWVAAADGTRQQALTFGRAGHTSKDETPSDVTISWRPGKGSLTFSRREVFNAERADRAPGIASPRAVAPVSVTARSILDVLVDGPQPSTATARYDLLDRGSTFVFADHAHPAWSPSGRKLAFTRNGDIWVTTAEGGLPGDPRGDWEARRVAAVARFDEPVRRASRDNRCATRLSWHPDERRLVYGYDRLQGSGFNEVHLLDTRAGHDSVVVRDALEPCVSPDGRFILYRAYGEACGPDGFCVCAISLDGRQRVKLVSKGSQPAW